MKVYVVFGSESLSEIDNEELVKIFATREVAENFIDQNDYWLYPRIEEWKVEE